MSTLLGKNIKQAREQAGFNQKELAEKLKVSQQTIWRWEKGDREPKWDTLRKIALILNAPSLAEFPEERAKREALLPPMKQEQGGTIGLSYWGSVVDNARDVAERGNLQEISLILPLLHSACELLLVSSDDAKRKKEQSKNIRTSNIDIHGNKMRDATFSFAGTE